MNMVMSGDGRGHLYHLNSLEFPQGHLADVARAREEIPLGRIVDVILTNPPFGSDIPITDEAILKQYDLAYRWEAQPDGSFENRGVRQSSVAPEVLFVERCLQWLKPGGRMGIVLPNGILGNPGMNYLRWWLLRQAWILASVDLPIEAFVWEANVNILTSLLFLQKKTDEEKRAEALGGLVEYPVFMAVAERVGIDRRGNKVYKRTPEGDDIITIQEETERIHVGDRVIERKLRRPRKELDDDLPLIAQAYHDFVAEEGSRLPYRREVR